MATYNYAPKFPILVTITNNLQYTDKDLYIDTPDGVREKNKDQLTTRPTRNIQFFQTNTFYELKTGASVMLMVDSSDALKHYCSFVNSGLTIKRSDEEDFYEFTEEEKEEIVDIFYDKNSNSGIAETVGVKDEQGNLVLAFAYNDIDWDGSTVEDIEAAFTKIDLVTGVETVA